MTEFMDHGAALAEPAAPHPAGRRLAGIGQRLAQTFSRTEPPDQTLQPTEQYSAVWQDDMPRFAMVRHGYHCAAVDQYVSELEQELADLDRQVDELRARPLPSGDVSAEIKRVGEQTSAVLIAAHEQAQETVREAEAEAERQLGEAKVEATAIVCRANQRLHEAEAEAQTVHGARERLLGDVRSAAAALTELVDVSFTRFPPQGTPAEPEASQPASDSSPVPA
ncbi:MAG TPA: DivIVA domain-containing protein [Solirubrobacteraceae bacterium]|nr:DivIVA domain-containing protein [Solirubrobacteraceae bacterium]